MSKEIIANGFDTAKKNGSAIAAIALKDSLRKVVGSKTVSKNRNEYYLVQTPQTFKSSLLKQAYNDAESINNFTDDASVFEASQGEVALINGDYKNLKITTPEDLIIAQALLTN
ncbi:2-C-methyl-D-erythritol 4-phosphate cytidylyltransferase [hydrothermal vent metagenome]|uniref:2-C-methyl-D-erythritol 4-phosphate cytidylyltransferase n=1 Tax=hydrothermal vent metagenome TaxID=652676 RepID=A0A3B0UNF7_9ZZZZ